MPRLMCMRVTGDAIATMMSERMINKGFLDAKDVANLSHIVTL